MKRRALNWLLMIVAAAALHLVLRYWFGDFQGYFTIPFAGTDYGFAHIKSSTVWVSGREFTQIPGILISAMVLAALAWLVCEVRLVWKSSVRKP
jgi:hypothetical protein